MLGALGFGAKKGHVLDTAVAALLTIQKEFLRRPLHYARHSPPQCMLVQRSGNVFQEWRKGGTQSEEVAVNGFQKPEVEPVGGRQTLSPEIIPGFWTITLYPI